jgi:hypothetical protein
MALLTSAQRSAQLKALGFLGTQTTMIRNFQRGWNLGPALVADGLYGPKTDAALKTSYGRMKAGQPTASGHFSFREFRCKCAGSYGSCMGVWVLRNHLRRLEVARAKLGRGVSVVSGCRCTEYNKKVGGAVNSQHLYGVACDVSFPNYRTVSGWRLFAGIGYKSSTGTTLHVDSRDIGGHNRTNGTPLRPTTWVYA